MKGTDLPHTPKKAREIVQRYIVETWVSQGAMPHPDVIELWTLSLELGDSAPLFPPTIVMAEDGSFQPDNGYWIKGNRTEEDYGL